MKILSTKDKSYNEVKERLVISRDCCDLSPRSDDNIFVLWSNCREYSGDKNAECPFIEGDDGYHKLRDGIVAFPVSVYDHTGLVYSIGDGKGFPDYRWDVTPNALWIWTNKERYEIFCGSNSWAETNEEKLRKIAGEEIHTLNLWFSGMVFSYEIEKRRDFVKTYDDGTSVSGYEYVFEDGCGGYICDDPNEIEDVYQGIIPVFADGSAECFIGREVGDNLVNTEGAK